MLGLFLLCLLWTLLKLPGLPVVMAVCALLAFLLQRGQVVATVGPAHGFLARFLRRRLQPHLVTWCARHGLHQVASDVGRSVVAGLSERLARGETVRMAGLTAGSHNAGLALVEVSAAAGTRLICSLEEERFSGRKHDHRFPQHCIDELSRHGLSFDAVAGSWDYPEYLAHGLSDMAAFAPASLSALLPRNTRTYEFFDPQQILGASSRLRMPVIGLRHHDNHAVFSYAVSPFAALKEPVLVLVTDGQGDDGNLTAWVVEDGEFRLLWRNHHLFDSIAAVYAVISSTQGGWTQLSSEGRFMGAAAWGCQDRLMNRYYRRLRQLLWFGPGGQVRLNTSMANWQRDGSRPYTRLLADILGPSLDWDQMWKPDAVLNVEAVQHAPATRDRVDKAAALQMLFEDAIIHVVDGMVHATGGKSSHLVWTGGAALNCLAGMRLVDRFDEAWFERTYDRTARLSLWVPPVPNDSGVAAGAAFNLASRALRGAGCRAQAQPLSHAFYGGIEPCSANDIRTVLDDPALESVALGPSLPAARLLALMVADGAVVGLFQGLAEMGPRALGHRSILANPTRPDTRTLLNDRVKFRERLRPLAPMVTRGAAERYFDLSPGAAGYDYMVLTVRARPGTAEVLPAVVHQDGTARLQIVNPKVDLFCQTYLEELGRLTGIEASVNTSLNVGAPMAQTPAQAVATLKRAHGMHGLLLITADQEAFLCWERAKGSGPDIQNWLHSWRS